MHVEAHLHDAVVDVGLVGFEHAFAVEFPLERHADDVDAGQEHEGEGDEQGFFAVGEAACFVRHLVLDGEVGNHIAQEEAAGIAHEGLEPSHFSVEVEEEEGEGGSGEADADEAEEVGVQLVVQVGEGAQDEEGDAGGQSVDAVYEVDGVDNQQDDEDGEWVANPKGYLVHAEESVEIANHQVAEGEQECSDGLDDELMGGFQSLEVVEDAYQIDEQGTYYHDDVGYANLEILVDALIHDEQCDGYAHSQGGHEECAAEPGNGLLVHFPRIGQVVYPTGVAYLHDEWCAYQ